MFLSENGLRLKRSGRGKKFCFSKVSHHSLEDPTLLLLLDVLLLFTERSYPYAGTRFPIDFI